MKETIYGPDEYINKSDECDDRIFIIVNGKIELSIKKNE
jgi:hypothetical protein